LSPSGTIYVLPFSSRRAASVDPPGTTAFQENTGACSCTTFAEDDPITPPHPSSGKNLDATHDMSVKRHTLYNLCGSLAPTFISLVTVPLFLRLIGDARYGVLAIVWLFLGYFGLFDPGLTKAAEFHIARLHQPGQEKERERVFWTAVVINLAFGLVGGVVLYLIARPIFHSFFKMPHDLRAEVIASLPWIAASLPVSIATGVLGGALQAREKFGLYSTIRIFNTAITQLAPLAVAYWHGPQLTWLIPTVLIARAVGAVPTMIALVRFLPLRGTGGFDRSLLKGLFSYGGWITVTNVLGPILSTLDRLLIGSLLNADAVAFYTVPFNLVGRVSALPAALQNSIFPKLSRNTKESSARLASEAVLALAAITTPVVAIGMGALPIFMRYWVGSDFARHSAQVGIILFIGIWVNGLAFIPYGHLQARGRPDIVAKFHAAEVLPFIGVLWLGLHYFGLVGAACAWTLRVTADAILLFMAGDPIPGWKRLIPGCLIMIASALASPTSILSMKMLLECSVIALAITWSWTLSPAVRNMVRGRWNFVRAKAAIG
jgi:O-antigen/teichoic acid export membrane protein